MADKLNIEIDAKILFQMYEYAAYAKHIFGTEIAGWGHYKKDKGIYKLAPLPKQIVRGAEVDTFPTEIINDVKYDISDMTVQWHSHVDMGVTPSPTDKQLIKEALRLYPFLISIIVNCRNEYFAELNVCQAGEIIFSSPINIELNLVPYYNNTVVLKEVKTKCRLPKPIVIETIKSQLERQTTTMKGWNPCGAMGLYVGKNFYPDSDYGLDYYIENADWNPLVGIYNRFAGNEKKIKYKRKYDEKETEKHNNKKPEREEQLPFPENEMILWNSEEKMIDELDRFSVPPSEDIEDDFTEADIKEAKKRAILLDKEHPNKFQMICADGTYYIQDLKTQTYCIINDIDGIVVNGDYSTWNEFLEKVHCNIAPFRIEKNIN